MRLDAPLTDRPVAPPHIYGYQHSFQISFATPPRRPRYQMRPATLPALLLTALMASLLGLTACAHRPAANDRDAMADYQENNDPLEPTNRVFYAVNNGLDTVILRPLAVGYRYAVPAVVRRPVSNLLANLGTPVIFANDVFQTHPRRAGTTFMRGLINTTVGVGGLFDVAADWGYKAHDNDFGITLALWNVPSGPFLFLPVLGPSNPRDATGYGVDVALDPTLYPANGGGFNTFRLVRAGVGAVDAREQVLDTTRSINKTSLDPYATYRSLYQQHRQSVIDQMRQDDAPTTPAWYLRQ